MNCKQVEVLVRTTPRSLWAPEQIAAAQTHASDCAECTALLAREQRFEAELQSLFEPTPSSDVLPIVMAQIENLPRQHAKTPSRQRRFLGIASKGVGIATALGAYLFSLIVNGIGAHFSVWDHELFVPIVPDASALVFVGGLLLYVAGVLMKGDEVMSRRDVAK